MSIIKVKEAILKNEAASKLLPCGSVQGKENETVFSPA